MAETALLVRCPYPFNKPQTWLPTDLYKLSAQLEQGGVSTSVVDLNLQQLPEKIDEYDFVGVGVIGPPYVPTAIGITELLFERGAKQIILGGQAIEHFSAEEFSKLFGNKALQAKTDADLAPLIAKPIISAHNTPTPLDKIPDDLLEQYLRAEFSFFISQGCKYVCSFCAAARTRPNNGQRVSESFSQTIDQDVLALCETASRFRIQELKLYLTSLDAFQNPAQFQQALKHFANATRKTGITFKLRCLSRIDSFLRALEQRPELATLISEAGLGTIGFGVDGSTEEVWRSQHKGINSLSEADKAFEKCNALGIIPEGLMVVGFHANNNHTGDTPESLRKSVDYALSRADSYGLVSRPYVAKDFVPGNDGWIDEKWRKQKERLLQEPELFWNLDYAALASKLTHPEPVFRALVNEAYMEIIDELTPRGLCTTTPIQPYRKGGVFDDEWNKSAQLFNQLVPFDR